MSTTASELIVSALQRHGVSILFGQSLPSSQRAALPVATTPMGKGAVDETHPLSVGVIGNFMGPGARPSTSDSWSARRTSCSWSAPGPTRTEPTGGRSTRARPPTSTSTSTARSPAGTMRRACGAEGITVRDPAELAAVFGNALDSTRTTVIEVASHPDAYPPITAWANQEDRLLRPAAHAAS